MSMQRISVSLPDHVYQGLNEQIPNGKVSAFVAQAIENKLISFNNDPIREFLMIKDKLPKKKDKEIIQAIKKGRRWRPMFWMPLLF